MASTLQCITVNDLTEMSFIAGSEKSLEFNIYDSTGSPLSLNGCTVKWYLFPYGEPTASVITKVSGGSGITISASPNNLFTVTVIGSDTLQLEGKYIQQPVIIDSATSEFRPSQGIINIFPAAQ